MSLFSKVISPSRTRTGTLFRARDFKSARRGLSSADSQGNPGFRYLRTNVKRGFTQSFTQSGKGPGNASVSLKDTTGGAS